MQMLANDSRSFQVSNKKLTHDGVLPPEPNLSIEIRVEKRLCNEHCFFVSFQAAHHQSPFEGRDNDVCQFLRIGLSFDLSAFDPALYHPDEIVSPAAESP